MGDVLKGLGQQLGLGIAEHLAQAPVDQQPTPVEADMGDTDRGLLVGAAKPRLAFGHKADRTGPLGHIDGDNHHNRPVRPGRGWARR